MIRRFLFLILLLLIVLPSFICYGQQKGEVIFSANFDSKDEMQQWSGTKKYRIKKLDGQTVARLKSRKDALLSISLPVEKVRGCQLSISARLKSEGITPPPNPWNGIKVMLRVHVPYNTVYPQLEIDNKSTSWQEASFNTLVTSNADSVELVIGLEKVKGKVWFDQINVTVKKPPYEAANNPAGETLPTYRTQYRGAMVNTFIGESDLRTLASWGANLVRWELMWGSFPRSSADTASAATYRAWLERALEHVDAMLPLCQQLGIKVVIDLHTLPGGVVRGGKGLGILDKKEWQDELIDIWNHIAMRYKSSPTVWGYDIANEPYVYTTPDSVMDWQQLATVVCKKIRQIDTMHYVIVEGVLGGTIPGLVSLAPIDVPRIVYSFHMYQPTSFTHQGIENDQLLFYPGIIDGEEWNRATLKEVMMQVKKWQEKANARVFVGEFSAIRWAPGESAYYYLRDCIDLFEEFGWDWTYHAFREYQGWSVEIGDDRSVETPEAKPTLRQQLLMDAYKRNTIK